ncbi:inositol phosphorylceramide synthase [Natronolimnobius sp. AArcel1]|uniref:phosphatase PAP2 family protein n=1 Tax=Natronolimnobius sp. AArcel1 TaxID=1679093 RepID=UPI0013EDF9E9|nr:phosphatase PAP2 family protein [Natronolimnobius sp. AArcel1]NGM70826.1 inositol phosphorylceramide synthase [Natronolimnobius sp. AArcel1]
MSFAVVLLELALVVTTMLVTAALVLVGPRRLVAAVSDFRWRLEFCLIPLLALGVVLLVRWSTVDITTRLERRVFSQNITQLLFEIDRVLLPGDPVAIIQSYQSPELTSFFVFIYIYGYAFLLLFPFIAYFALEEMEHLEALILSFTANYGIGLLCYMIFLAYGPRNFDPVLFEGLLYEAFPRSRELTNSVNQSTNVFPSLHTSLSMTVLFLAWVSRDKYPLWLGLSAFLAISVVISTMYLGIHWFSDVIAGTGLALLSVYIGYNYTVSGLYETARGYLSTQYEQARLDR